MQPTLLVDVLQQLSDWGLLHVATAVRQKADCEKRKKEKKEKKKEQRWVMLRG